MTPEDYAELIQLGRLTLKPSTEPKELMEQTEIAMLYGAYEAKKLLGKTFEALFEDRSDMLCFRNHLDQQSILNAVDYHNHFVIRWKL